MKDRTRRRWREGNAEEKTAWEQVKREIEESSGSRNWAYLIRVHFELSHDLDRDFIASLCISRLVDIAESPIAHLFHQNKSFETGVSGHLPCLFSLFSDDGVNIGLDFLGLARGMCCGTSGLGSDVAIIDGGSGIFTMVRLDMLLNVSIDAYGIADGVFLVLSMDGGDVGSGLIAGMVGGPGLLAVTYEVLEVLNGAHLSRAQRRQDKVER